jgi:hypothetical protein
MRAWAPVPANAVTPADLVPCAVRRVIGLGNQLRLIISPRTLLRWHAHLVRRLWTCPRRAHGRPRTTKPIRVLILQMARDNPTWDTGVSLRADASDAS